MKIKLLLMHHYCGKVEPLEMKAKHTLLFSEREGSVPLSPSLNTHKATGMRSGFLAWDSLNISFLVCCPKADLPEPDSAQIIPHTVRGTLPKTPLWPRPSSFTMTKIIFLPLLQFSSNKKSSMENPISTSQAAIVPVTQ